jgi:phosphorylcholine metabolism protein LicD
MDRKLAKQLLLDVANILDQLQIPFFLMQGTALGAYRDHGFVPTEKDIDLGVLQEYLTSDAVQLLTREFIQQRYDVELFVQPFSYVRTMVLWGQNCKLDLVGWTKCNEKRFTATPVREWIDKPYAIVHNSQMLESYQELEMFGRMWKVPSPIEEYLVLEYGSSWKTPQEDHISRTRIYNYLEQEGLPSDT